MTQVSKTGAGPLLDGCLALRYDVFCREKRFLSARAYPTGREQDTFDDHAVHFAAVDAHQNVRGTVRLVSHSEAGFPMDRHCGMFPGVLPKALRNTTAEISRLAVDGAHRRVGSERFASVRLSSAHESSALSAGSVANGRRSYTEALFALFKAVYQESRRLGLTHWIAAMEPALRRMMRAYFLVDFQPAGPPTEYHGTVVPYLADLAVLDRALAEGDPALAAALMEGLEAEFRPAWAKSRAENPPGGGAPLGLTISPGSLSTAAPRGCKEPG